MNDRTCHMCGKTPAEGFASIWTSATGERWYCHGDDDAEPTCYETANWSLVPAQDVTITHKFKFLFGEGE